MAKEKLVKSLPKLWFQKDNLCDACQMDKQAKATDKGVRIRSYFRNLGNQFALVSLVIPKSMDLALLDPD